MIRDEDSERRLRDELLAATSEEWARLEGQAIGRVLDDDTPTHPIELPPDERPTTPRLDADLPEWAEQALAHEALGLGPYEPGPAELFAPTETILIPAETLRALRRRSTPPHA